jgi:hypothetical protein
LVGREREGEGGKRDKGRGIREKGKGKRDKGRGIREEGLCGFNRLP